MGLLCVAALRNQAHCSMWEGFRQALSPRSRDHPFFGSTATRGNRVSPETPRYTSSCMAADLICPVCGAQASGGQMFCLSCEACSDEPQGMQQEASAKMRKDGWPCQVCTVHNLASQRTCAACGVGEAPGPPSGAAHAASNSKPHPMVIAEQGACEVGFGDTAQRYLAFTLPAL